MIPLFKLPIVYKFQIFNDANIIGHVATVGVLTPPTVVVSKVCAETITKTEGPKQKFDDSSKPKLT